MADMPRICLSQKGSLLELDGGGKGRTLSPSGGREPLVVLCPFRTLAIHPYELPLMNLAQIREALKLRFQPYLAGGTLELLPTVLAKEAKKSRGVAWLVSRVERDAHERLLGGRQARLIPAVLALAAGGDPDGAVLGDEDHLYSVAFRNGEPLAFRCQPRSRRDFAAEVAWLREFLGDGEAEIVTADLADAEEETLARLHRGAENLLAPDHRLGAVDLSGKAIDAALRVDRFMATTKKAVYALVAGGTCAVLVTAAFLFFLKADMRDLQERSVALYREAFGDEGVIRDPLSQARARLMTSQGGSAAPDLAEILSSVGVAWAAGETLKALTLETLRYNAFGSDVVGVAPDVKDIESLQARLKEQGLESRLGDIQQTSGGKLRFSLSLRWEQP